LREKKKWLDGHRELGRRIASGALAFLLSVITTNAGDVRTI